MRPALRRRWQAPSSLVLGVAFTALLVAVARSSPPAAAGGATSPAAVADADPACLVTLPLPRDTDLYAVPGSPDPTGPHVRLVTRADPAVLATEVPGLTFDAAANPDGVAIADLTLPIPALPCPTRTLALLTAAQGPVDAHGIAADGTIVWSDGTEQPLKWMVGEQAWPTWAGATGRGADAVELGVDAAGDVVTASLMRVPLVPPNPGATPTALHLHARGGLNLVLLDAILAGKVADAGLPTTRYDAANLTPFRWSGWFTRSLLPEMPAEIGPVRVTADHLTFADGRPARFWGVNLVGGAALPAVDDAAGFANHLSALGFNLVRLHHIDTDDMIADPHRGDVRADGTQEPLTNAEALDRLDHFTAALDDAGVFQELELVTQHPFRTAEGVNHPANVVAGYKWVTNFEDDWENAEEAWARAVWGRVNPYTALRYADDPHVAMIELENENSLVTAWSAGQLERLPRAHQDQLDAVWNGWLAKKYGTDAKIAAAWSGSLNPGLGPTELLVASTIRRVPDQRTRTDQWPTQRAIDLVQFYSELELQHEARLTAFVRNDLGFKGPLICNTAFGVPQADVLLARCDVIDLHLYWDNISETNVFTDNSLLRAPWAGRFLERFGACQAGKPCIMTEVQESFPNRHAQEAPLFWSGLASRQGIDAVTWFAWSHATARRDPDGPVGALDLEGRWGTMMQMPAAAWLFRSGAVEELGHEFDRWWSPAGLRRDLAEQPGLWLAEFTDPASLTRQRVRSAYTEEPPAPHEGTEPDPAQFAWSPTSLIAPLTIVTPRLEAVVGGSGTAGDLVVDVLGSPPDPAVSLERHTPDDALVGRLVVAGPTIRAGTLFRGDGYGTVVGGLGPAGLAPVQVYVTFLWPHRPSLTPITGTVGVLPTVSVARKFEAREGPKAPGETYWTVAVAYAGWWTIR